MKPYHWSFVLRSEPRQRRVLGSSGWLAQRAVTSGQSVSLELVDDVLELVGCHGYGAGLM